jgi:hypothetical protein
LSQKRRKCAQGFKFCRLGFHNREEHPQESSAIELEVHHEPEVSQSRGEVPQAQSKTEKNRRDGLKQEDRRITRINPALPSDNRQKNRKQGKGRYRQ